MKFKKPEDPSNALFFIKKFISEFESNQISEKQFFDKLLPMFKKFPPNEIIDALSDGVKIMLYNHCKPIYEDESIYTELSSFGPEAECEMYMKKILNQHNMSKIIVDDFFRRNKKRFEFIKNI